LWKEELQHGSDAQLTFIVDKLQQWEQIVNFSNEHALPLLHGQIPNPLQVILVFLLYYWLFNSWPSSNLDGPLTMAFF